MRLSNAETADVDSCADALNLTQTDIEVMDKQASLARASPGTNKRTDELTLDAIQTRAQTALTLKARGNKLYASKQYQDAIAYYTKAIECEEQAVFYSNRAACESRGRRNDTRPPTD